MPPYGPMDVLRCPCGREGYSQSILGHRSQSKKKGLRECEGPLVRVEGPAPQVGTGSSAGTVASLVTGPPTAPQDAEPAGEDPFPQAQSWAYPASYGDVDERDRVARALLAEETGGGGRPPSANGSGAPPQEISPDGLYQEPTAPVIPSTTSISVALPADIKIMYDWARAQGWNQDDGSLGAFVYDMVSTHFRGGSMCEKCLRWVGECLGLEIYVGPKVEVMRSD